LLSISQPENLWPGDTLKEGWIADTLLNEYTADNLYELVNGGADLYFEYGFGKVVNGSFLKEDKQILIDIYQMKDATAAYGIYSFYRSANSVTLDIGDEASLMDYYLSLWMGKYFISLTAYDSDSISVAGLKLIAAEIAGKSRESGSVPRIMNLFSEFPEEERKGVKYLKGKLAAINQYNTRISNMYNFTDGAVIFSGESKIFVFRHDSTTDCESVFSLISEEINKEEKVAYRRDELILYKDNYGKYVHIEKAVNYHLLVVGEDKGAVEVKAEKIKAGIVNSYK
jgi:hypothetical protein